MVVLTAGKLMQETDKGDIVTELADRIAFLDQGRKLVAENRRARFDYLIEDTLEAGIQLVGTEVKSLRSGRANIAESYASSERGERDGHRGRGGRGGRWRYRCGQCWGHIGCGGICTRRRASK